ncbi:sigma-70 family RNA polymerase sigma factor [Chitinophaga filiformis]|uniref:RNA polymerase sigma factor n=1 Tax=Chitinophaga filiformis TaxID=104663 RepID=UPI001F3B8D02|nr:sigma-70 family RNA polymerase sigma factor [Chitinophaga filiformis]MCF6401340.1 sigma-70 family RNA polymerase sigma factor [Chitinophaga filiformis]
MEQEVVSALFKTEYRKIVSVLCKLFGLEHIQIAEDIVSDVFLLACETWGLKGLPENPTAWIYLVSKNRTKDYLKRNNLFRQKIQAEIVNSSSADVELELDLSHKNIEDSQLQMMFAICHPSIPSEAQIALSLRLLCGFGIDEIANAFQTNKETINKRLFRAKEKLRKDHIKLEFPAPSEITGRLEAVATTLYLLFNEGYFSTQKDIKLQEKFCLEAMQLTYLLASNKATNLPFIQALLSLMCFHSSRFDARLDEDGDYILYEKQNEGLWNQELIERGKSYLYRAFEAGQISKYHYQAAIAYWHTHQADSAEKWENILQLYNHLLQIEYSPITALNRTFASYKVQGKAIAIAEAEKLKLDNNHLYHSLLGELYTGIDDRKAIVHFEQALELAKSKADKKIIVDKLSVLR